MRLANKVRRGVKNPQKALSYIKAKGFQNALATYRNQSIAFNSRKTIGTNVFNQNWDLLIILDTCRVDALRTVSSEFSCIPEVGSIYSVGGSSPEWIAKTFDLDYEDDIENTAYISANPHSETVLGNGIESNWDPETENKDVSQMRSRGDWNLASKDDLGHYEGLWKYEGRGYKYCPPRYVTDRGITLSREHDFDKTILHYMPPHGPYTLECIPEGSNLKDHQGDEFGYLERTGNRDEVFRSYLNMLRWVLEEIELLLENSNYRNVAISADHGEAFGEFGVFYHHAGSLHPQIRRVPWAETSAEDTRSYIPSFSPDDDGDYSEQSVKETLKSLGYLE
ncbi:alkaline phosphatase family protein [Haloarcula salina]|uniref:Uncharacterized protein n=1 Tax=Haloarcula salina TaxID=1429914 RepID=A0AA41FYM8_9EURY|nr:hypothetical protein [Haloarcula salina]MBV0900409.1 hypothetical protein [Haloarcula salina]